MSWKLPAAFAAALLAGTSPAAETPPAGTIRSHVVGVQVVDMSGLTRVSLRAEGGHDRPTVDIYVGPSEGQAIARALSGERTPRPMTHDLFASVLSEFGARISRLTVSSLEESVFIGKLVVVAEGEEHVIDTRPSDGMALAVAAGAPIYVSEQIVRAAGRREEGDAEAEEAEGEADVDKARNEEDEGKREGEGGGEKGDGPPLGPRPFGPPRDLI